MSILAKICIMVWVVTVAFCFLTKILDIINGYDERRKVNRNAEPPWYYAIAGLLLIASVVAVPLFAVGVLFM